MLYDISENRCINLDEVIEIQLIGWALIEFIFQDYTRSKCFETKEEAREEYDRIKAMINNLPMIMTGDREN